MTGIEQLRKLGADAVRGGEVGRAICDIADQIERETEEQSARLYDERVGEETGVCELFGVEPVDDPLTSLRRHVEGLRDTVENLRLELGEARDDAAWVRAHGGLDYVKSEWRSRVPHDRYERRRQRLLGHIAECETALRRRNERIAELEGRVKALTTENAELRKRAMPEGMEWPKYDTGEMVDFGDEVDRGDGVGASVDKVSFYGDQWRLYDRYGCEINEDMMGPGERVKRPAPNVLDADGVEIRVGDVLYRKSDGQMVKVVEVYEKTFTDADDCVRPGEGYTHRAPAFAADGRPLRKGETVWSTKGGSYHLTSVHDGKVFARHVGGSFGAEVESAGGNGLYQLRSDQLTHTEPEHDTWERIERDAKVIDETIESEWGGDCTDARDIVRRAKALAERGA